MERERNGKRSRRDSLEDGVAGGGTNGGIGSTAAGAGGGGSGAGEGVGTGVARRDWISCWSWASVNTLRLPTGGGGVSELSDIGEGGLEVDMIGTGMDDSC